MAKWYDKSKLTSAYLSGANSAMNRAQQASSKQAELISRAGQAQADVYNAVGRGITDTYTKVKEAERQAKKDADIKSTQDFYKGLIGPKQVEGGVITDARSADKWAEMGFTAEEEKEYDRLGGSLDNLDKGSTLYKKAKAQQEVSDFAANAASNPAYLESKYAQAQRVAGGLDTMPTEVIKSLMNAEAADATQQEARKKERLRLLGKGTELDAKISELRTKIGAVEDEGLRYGKEDAKADARYSGGGSGIKSKDLDKVRSAVKDELGKLDLDNEDVQTIKRNAETLYRKLAPTVGKDAAEEFVRSRIKTDDGIIYDTAKIESEDLTDYADELKEMKDAFSRKGGRMPKSREADAIKAQIAGLEAQKKNYSRQADEYKGSRRDAMLRSIDKELPDFSFGRDIAKEEQDSPVEGYGINAIDQDEEGSLETGNLSSAKKVITEIKENKDLNDQQKFDTFVDAIEKNKLPPTEEVMNEYNRLRERTTEEGKEQSNRQQVIAEKVNAGEELSGSQKRWVEDMKKTVNGRKRLEALGIPATPMQESVNPTSGPVPGGSLAERLNNRITPSEVEEAVYNLPTSKLEEYARYFRDSMTPADKAAFNGNSLEDYIKYRTEMDLYNSRLSSPVRNLGGSIRF